MSDFNYSEKLKDKLDKCNQTIADTVSTDILGYQSPVEVIMSDFQSKFEADCLQVVRSYGFNVNKEELQKALAYDRNQYSEGYQRGYTDAKNKFARPKGEWIDEGLYAEGHSEHAYICKNCGYQIIVKPIMIFEERFCKYCGADMRKEPENEED